MRKIILFFVIVCSLFLSGCASQKPYFINRGRDAADIFTATMGMGFGARGSVGPAHIGFLFNIDGLGLLSGEHISNDCYGVEFDSFIIPMEPEIGDLLGTNRGYGIMFGTEGVTGELIKKRNKEYDTDSIVPFLSTSDVEKPFGILPSYFYTKIDVIAGCLLSIHLGFNPGELMDFVLGWTTLDIYKDDIEKADKDTNKEEEETK